MESFSAAPDREGNFENIVLGYSDLADYQTNIPNFGVVVGRVAGRIKGAQFELEGQTYNLANNDGAHHLHGGPGGFSHLLWDGEIIDSGAVSGVQFTYLSPDGEEGYPGNLKVTVTYTLDNDNRFTITYQGQSDKTTLFAPTNHTYFNLSGNCQEDILGHVLKIDSSRFVELDCDLIPTGNILPVSGTTFDFRAGHSILEGTLVAHPQNQLALSGYDHPFILDSHKVDTIALWYPVNGRRITVKTDAPGVVLYTGNQLPDTLNILGGKSRKYLGLCLETQAIPDAIHNLHFPSYILHKNKLFSSQTQYTFGITK